MCSYAGQSGNDGNQQFTAKRAPISASDPAQQQSGDCDPQWGITQTGNSYLRSLLVQSSQYILGCFGPDSELRRRGLKLAACGGKRGKKRAIVAVARKLAVPSPWHEANLKTFEPFPQPPTH